MTISENTKCAAPAVVYNEGKLNFTCETTGVEYHYNICDSDATASTAFSTCEVELKASETITIFATAYGYSPSDVSTATIYWLNEHTNLFSMFSLLSIKRYGT